MEQTIEVPKKKVRRQKRKTIKKETPGTSYPGFVDDDPFVDCNSGRWTLKRAFKHINKYHLEVPKSHSFLNKLLQAKRFQTFPNSILISLFCYYAKLEVKLQNKLRIFYFGLEKSNPSRFRNITRILHKENIFNRYPWLCTDGTIKEQIDVKFCKRRIKKNSELKPFSEACKQYEIEKKRNSEIQSNTQIHINENFNQIDKNLSLSSSETINITMMNNSYQDNSLIDATNTLEKNINQTQNRKLKRSRWSSPSTDTNNTIYDGIPILANTNIKLETDEMIHFTKRKIKLISQLPLSLGDLIVLVSYFYKLEYIEQQLLIEQMKILESTKPYQAAYLRQYVRTTCPLYDENEIHFKPLPENLIESEMNMDLRKVTCIEDILKEDFCVSKDDIPERFFIFKNTFQELSNNEFKTDTKEFDFGSEFL